MDAKANAQWTSFAYRVRSVCSALRLTWAEGVQYIVDADHANAIR